MNDSTSDQTAHGAIDSFRLDGRVSLITGASRGIGLAIAAGLAGAGSDLVINGRHGDTLEKAAGSIRETTGRRVEILVGDISDGSLARSIGARAVEAAGRLDIFVNNAGTNRRSDSASYSEEDWDAVVDLNLRGAFFAAQSCGNAMIEAGRGGKIINILSMASVVALAGAPAYSAAKGGLLQLTKTLAVEWAPHDIQVNGIGPGFIRTTLNRPLQESATSDWIVRRTPARRWGETGELVGAAIFLASPASDFVTGQAIYVDGGFLAGSDWRSGD